ncbi:MAG: TetR family transcriptional regulator [Microthrixaceae bacterium]
MNSAVPTAHAHAVCVDPEAPNRRERKVLETRKAIIAAAKALIRDQGYAETTVDQIAERADIAPRTFFRYFPNKESLLFAEFDAEREAMLSALAARPDEEDIFDSLAIVLEKISQVVDQKWDDYMWAHEVIRSQSTDGTHERALMRQHVDARIAEIIAKRIGADLESDPRPFAWAMTIMSVFGQSMAKGPHASPTGRTFDTFIEMLASTESALGQMRTSAVKLD